MANIDLLKGEKDLHHNRGGNVKTPYLVERTIDFADLARKKGSALATGDVIFALKIPAQTAVLASFAGKGKDVDSTTLTFTVAGDIVGPASFNAKGATSVAGVFTQTVHPAAGDSVDVALTFTGNLTSGSIRVGILVLDLSAAVRGGLAKNA